MNDQLGQLLTAMRGFEGRAVAVRTVTDTDELLTVFRGTLQALSDEKRPALFWPIDEAPIGAGEADWERPGIYLHSERLEEVSVHPGGFVVEFRQAGVTVNVRRTS